MTRLVTIPNDVGSIEALVNTNGIRLGVRSKDPRRLLALSPATGAQLTDAVPCAARDRGLRPPWFPYSSVVGRHGHHTDAQSAACGCAAGQGVWIPHALTVSLPGRPLWGRHARLSCGK